MSIHIYHPTKTVKGFACSFWYSERDNSVYATLIKQSGWDAENQNGTFKDSLNDPNKKISIKLSFTEVGGIIDAIESNRAYSWYHDGEATHKQIGFAPWFTGVDESKKQTGFSFSISVVDKNDKNNKNPFYIGLNFAEARHLKEYLIFILHKTFKRNFSASIEEKDE